MKLYLISRTKGDYTHTLICANYHTVIDALSHLDGTDEEIRVNFSDVADTYAKTDKK